MALPCNLVPMNPGTPPWSLLFLYSPHIIHHHFYPSTFLNLSTSFPIIVTLVQDNVISHLYDRFLTGLTASASAPFTLVIKDIFLFPSLIMLLCLKILSGFFIIYLSITYTNSRHGHLSGHFSFVLSTPAPLALSLGTSLSHLGARLLLFLIILS